MGHRNHLLSDEIDHFRLGDIYCQSNGIIQRRLGLAA